MDLELDELWTECDPLGEDTDIEPDDGMSL